MLGNIHTGTVAEGAPIIPISAQLKYNIEVVCEYITKKVPIPRRDFLSPPRLIGKLVNALCTYVQLGSNNIKLLHACMHAFIHMINKGLWLSFKEQLNFQKLLLPKCLL